MLLDAASCVKVLVLTILIILTQLNMTTLSQKIRSLLHEVTHIQVGYLTEVVQLTFFLRTIATEVELCKFFGPPK